MCRCSRVEQSCVIYVPCLLLSICVVVLRAAVRRQRGDCIPKQSTDACAAFVRPVAWWIVLWPYVSQGSLLILCSVCSRIISLLPFHDVMNI